MLPGRLLLSQRSMFLVFGGDACSKWVGRFKRRKPSATTTSDHRSELPLLRVVRLPCRRRLWMFARPTPNGLRLVGCRVVGCLKVAFGVGGTGITNNLRPLRQIEAT